ncbi:anaerobic C4-dicarboxylate transporter [Virgibacillus natechei]|uniref:Anaerobic C4-dicarboxylate transporter n=1 Tax=Virgibacillus natechei TaxID=1216297 RepID=A0ABS4IFK3_9BACI|nr:SA1362 family protein [Virgibacillus natechei]MBP1969724.1 anaerobic C4-dicarboxylate transporter [Virgibacillus natechei]UZD11449.1 hypothetical protein OLD84_10750 [Virgibacillus natechei]
MARSKLSVLIYILIGLAVVGVVSQLFTNTINFLTNIIIMIAIGVAIFAAFYFIFFRKRNPSNSNEMKKYKKAVKHSKAKYKDNKTAITNKKPQSIQSKKKLNKRATHLRVIDGNKHKKKDRATF